MIPMPLNLARLKFARRSEIAIFTQFKETMQINHIPSFWLLDVTATTTKVKGPDGYIFLIGMAVLIALPILYFAYRSAFGKKRPASSHTKPRFWARKKVTVVLEKDRMYYPDTLSLIVKNTGKTDVDLDRPLLIFRNFWTKRKFRLKGTARYSFYPLLLEPGKTHELAIDLNHFYRHDKRLKRYPRITLVVSDVNGKKFPPKSVMLRKTLFR